MDVWEYYGQKEREFADMSVDGRSIEYFEEEGSNGQHGHFLGHVYFEEETYLEVHERIEITANGVPHRVDYAYFLVMGGVEFWGYERDPTHNPPDHRHTANHVHRIPCQPISFKQACEMVWREISLRESTSTDE